MTRPETIAFMQAYFDRLRVLFDTLDLESLAAMSPSLRHW